jgi:hypothetical protein
MNEHSFVKAVHRKLPPEVYKWKIHDTYTGGVPDAMYAGPAGLLFVEYKYLKSLPKKPTTPIKTGLSELQISWLERMLLYNVLVLVIIGSPSGAVVLTKDFRRTLTMSNFDATLSASECAEQIVDLATNHERRKPTYTCPEPTENLG